MNMLKVRRYAMRMGALAMCSVALCTMPLLAQGGGMQGGGVMRTTPEARVAAIDKAVTLTEDQKTKIMAMYTADKKKMMDLRDAQDPDMRSKMMTMRADENTQIKAMLSDDQRPKFDAYLASMPHGRWPGDNGGAAPTPPAPPQ